MKVQPQVLSKLLLLHRILLVNLVAEHHERHCLQFLHLQQTVQLLLSLCHALSVGSVHHKDDAVELTAVLAPGLACLQMPTQIVGVKADVTDSYFGLMRVDRGVGLSETIRLEHVQESGLASVVKAQEDNVGRLLVETQPLKG